MASLTSEACRVEQPAGRGTPAGQPPTKPAAAVETRAAGGPWGEQPTPSGVSLPHASASIEAREKVGGGSEASQGVSAATGASSPRPAASNAYSAAAVNWPQKIEDTGSAGRGPEDPSTAAAELDSIDVILPRSVAGEAPSTVAAGRWRRVSLALQVPSHRGSWVDFSGAAVDWPREALAAGASTLFGSIGDAASGAAGGGQRKVSLAVQVPSQGGSWVDDNWGAGDWPEEPSIDTLAAGAGLPWGSTNEAASGAAGGGPRKVSLALQFPSRRSSLALQYPSRRSSAVGWASRPPPHSGSASEEGRGGAASGAPAAPHSGEGGQQGMAVREPTVQVSAGAGQHQQWVMLMFGMGGSSYSPESLASAVGSVASVAASTLATLGPQGGASPAFRQGSSHSPEQLLQQARSAKATTAGPHAALGLQGWAGPALLEASPAASATPGTYTTKSQQNGARPALQGVGSAPTIAPGSQSALGPQARVSSALHEVSSALAPAVSTFGNPGLQGRASPPTQPVRTSPEAASSPAVMGAQGRVSPAVRQISLPVAASTHTALELHGGVSLATRGVSAAAGTAPGTQAAVGVHGGVSPPLQDITVASPVAAGAQATQGLQGEPYAPTQEVSSVSAAAVSIQSALEPKGVVNSFNGGVSAAAAAAAAATAAPNAQAALGLQSLGSPVAQGFSTEAAAALSALGPQSGGSPAMQEVSLTSPVVAGTHASPGLQGGASPAMRGISTPAAAAPGTQAAEGVQDGVSPAQLKSILTPPLAASTYAALGPQGGIIPAVQGVSREAAAAPSAQAALRMQGWGSPAAWGGGTTAAAAPSAHVALWPQGGASPPLQELSLASPVAAKTHAVPGIQGGMSPVTQGVSTATAAAAAAVSGRATLVMQGGVSPTRLEVSLTPPVTASTHAASGAQGLASPAAPVVSSTPAAAAGTHAAQVPQGWVDSAGHEASPAPTSAQAIQGFPAGEVSPPLEARLASSAGADVDLASGLLPAAQGQAVQKPSLEAFAAAANATPAWEPPAHDSAAVRESPSAALVTASDGAAAWAQGWEIPPVREGGLAASVAASTDVALRTQGGGSPIPCGRLSSTGTGAGPDGSALAHAHLEFYDSYLVPTERALTEPALSRSHSREGSDRGLLETPSSSLCWAPSCSETPTTPAATSQRQQDAGSPREGRPASRIPSPTVRTGLVGYARSPSRIPSLQGESRIPTPQGGSRISTLQPGQNEARPKSAPSASDSSEAEAPQPPSTLRPSSASSGLPRDAHRRHRWANPTYLMPTISSLANKATRKAEEASSGAATPRPPVAPISPSSNLLLPTAGFRKALEKTKREAEARAKAAAIPRPPSRRTTGELTEGQSGRDKDAEVADLTTEERLVKKAKEEYEALKKHLKAEKESILQAKPTKPQAPQEPTVPVPFKLESQERHGQYLLDLMKRLEADKQAARLAAEFKATPFDESVKAGVGAHKVPNVGPSPAEFKDPSLYTEHRMVETKEVFEELKARALAHAEQLAKAREERKKLREEKELAEIEEYRRQHKFKAAPAPDFNQLHFKPDLSKKSPSTTPRPFKLAAKSQGDRS